MSTSINRFNIPLATQCRVPAFAVVLNYGRCSLCHQPYLLDSSGSKICGRNFCRAAAEQMSIAFVSKEQHGHLRAGEFVAWWREQRDAERQQRRESYGGYSRARKRGHHAVRVQ